MIPTPQDEIYLYELEILNKKLTFIKENYNEFNALCDYETVDGMIKDLENLIAYQKEELIIYMIKNYEERNYE